MWLRIGAAWGITVVLASAVVPTVDVRASGTATVSVAAPIVAKAVGTPVPAPEIAASADLPASGTTAVAAVAAPADGAPAAAPTVAMTGYLTEIEFEEGLEAPEPDMIDDGGVRLLHVPGQGYVRVDLADSGVDPEGQVPLQLELQAPEGSSSEATFSQLAAASAQTAPLEVVEAQAQPASVFEPAAGVTTHRIYAVLVTPSNVSGSSPASNQTASAVSSAVSAIDSYWSQQSGGSIRYSLAGTTSWYRGSYSCADLTYANQLNLWNQAASRATSQLGYSAGNDVHLALFFPSGSSCGGASGLGTVGTTVDSGGMVWVVGTNQPGEISALAHELGHNMSLGHADWLDCDTTDPYHASTSSCTARTYGDITDVMAFAVSGRTGGALSSVGGIRSGIWDASAWTVVPDGVSTVTLKPVSGNTGLRAAVVRDTDGTDWVVEYRDLAGEDAPYANLGCSVAYRFCALTERSVRIMRLDGSLDDTSAGDHSYVVGRVDGGVKTISYTVGETFRSDAAGNGIEVTVQSISASSATVQISKLGGYDGPGSIAIDNSTSPLRAVIADWPAGTTATYQWLRNGLTISGATGASYSPGPSDYGQLLSVRVVATVPGYQPVARTSAARDYSLVPSGSAVVDGDGVVGATAGVLSPAVTGGGQSVTPSTVTYQWYRDGGAISGANGAHYEIAGADYGHAVSARTTISAPGWVSVSVSSNTLQVSEEGTIEVEVVPPSLSVDGGGLVSAGFATADAVTASGVSTAYQWYRDGWPIPGQTAATYRLQSADWLATIRVKVTLQKVGYRSIVLYSDADTSFSIIPVTRAGVAGTPAVGKTLSAVAPSYRTTAPSVTLSYQWYRDGSVIHGATSATYAPTSADAGRVISYTVRPSAAGYLAITSWSSKVAVSAG